MVANTLNFDPNDRAQIEAALKDPDPDNPVSKAIAARLDALRDVLEQTTSQQKTLPAEITFAKPATGLDEIVIAMFKDALAGARTESLIAPQLRKLYPSLPLAPDGKDWADIIVCPIAGEGSLAWVLHSAWNDGRDQDVGYVWADQGVYYEKESGKLVSSGRNGGRCLENYRDALKIYLGDKPLGNPS